ncbi:MAG TPA: hypothetical protein VGC41_24125, partial [Kofleriaceae bacterium]
PPRLADARGKRTAGHKAEVVQYLRSAPAIVFSPGVLDDVFDASKDSDSPSVLTDGVFAWSQDIAYYVEKYDIELPRELENHIEMNKWTIPRGLKTSELRLPPRR